MAGLIFVPIELLEERYSKQWYAWFVSEFTRQGVVYTCVGDMVDTKITSGQFLDVFDTNSFKLRQSLEIISKIKNGFSGTIFYMDLWFPSIEAVGYIRDLAKRDIKIVGMLHAGTWDPHDFLSQNNLVSWARGFEQSIFDVAASVIVATEFHKQLILSTFPSVPPDKLKVIPWPVFYAEKYYGNTVRQDIVLFPHRLAPEKQPWVFEEVEKLYRERYGSGVQFITTINNVRTKQELYALMSRSKVVFSSALQETFGIAMVEGLNCGCIPVAPNRLSYPEVLPRDCLYSTLSEAVEKIHTAIIAYKPMPPYKEPWIERIVSWVTSL